MLACPLQGEVWEGNQKLAKLMFGIEWVCFERRRESKSRCKILKIVDLVLAPLGWVVIKNGDEDDA